jgi:hypothetical protein
MKINGNATCDSEREGQPNVLLAGKRLRQTENKRTLKNGEHCTVAPNAGERLRFCGIVAEGHRRPMTLSGRGLRALLRVVW